MIQPEKRNLNNPLSSSVFDDNKQVENTRPPTRVSKRTGLSIPPKGQGDYYTPIYTDDVSKLNKEAEVQARKNARKGGKYIENEDGTQTWKPSPYYMGEPVDYSWTEIVKGDDGKWSKVQRNMRMRKPGVENPKVDKIKMPFLKDAKGNVVTAVGEDGVKRGVRGVQNTQTNEPIRKTKTKGGIVHSNRGTSNTNTTNTTNKSNTTNTSPSEVKVSKGRTSSTTSSNKGTTSNNKATTSSNKGTTYTERTGKQTQRGTGKTYEDAWNNSTPEYKKRFGGDKKKAIQAMKDWNAEQDAKNAKKNTPTKKKNASASTVSEAKKKKQTSRSMFDKIPQGRKI